MGWTLADPTNCWTHAQKDIASAIAESSTFQTMTGSADATEAAEKIYEHEFEKPADGRQYTIDELASYKGWAILETPRDNPYRLQRRRTEVFESFGSVAIQIERGYTYSNGASVFDPVFDLVLSGGSEPDPSPEWVAQQKRVSENYFGQILGESLEWFNENAGIWIKEAVVSTAYRNEDKKRDVSQAFIDGVVVRFEWGLE